MFVTSKLTDGNIRALVPTATDGLAAADVICTKVADARLLDGTWRAFLSVAGTAAPSRQVGVGPWRQLDGGVVFNNTTALTAGLATATGLVTLESGANPTGARFFWTGTTTAGGVDPATCTGWTTGVTGQGASGTSDVGAINWRMGLDPCMTARRLFCVEQDVRPLRFSEIYNNPKRMFVTRSTYNGNLGGGAGADMKCQTVATARSLGGTWRALLSTDTVRAVDRQALRGPFTIMDGGVVFNNRFGVEYGLTATTGASVTDEFGVPLTNATFWSGTSGYGAITSTGCSGWTSASIAESGTIGITGTTTSFDWDNASGVTSQGRCSLMNSLLCVEN